MKAVTIPTNLLHELLALCEPEDHELRDRVTISAANSAQAGALDAELMRDAQRYRWLRKSPNPACDIKLAEHFSCGRGEDFDAKIDAACAAQGGV